MSFCKMFRTPYLDAPTDQGGGNAAPPSDPTPPAGDTVPPNTDTPPPVDQPKIKVKFNHEEKEIPYDEAVTHIQKGMNYEKAIEKTKQEAYQAARDAYIAEQGYEHNGKPIKTEAEYREALKEVELRKKYAELPEDVVNELIESKKFREQSESERRTKAEHEKKSAEFSEFFEAFKIENGRDFNSATDTIPPEVWELNAKGKSLADAYAIHLSKQLKTKVAKYEAKLKAQETNAANADSTPGSVTGNGSTKEASLTPEMIENMTPDELMKRWPEVKKVMKMR